MSGQDTTGRLLVEHIRSLVKDEASPTAHHCVFQDEFLLQFVAPNVSPPLPSIPVTSTCGYVVASSYAPTGGSDDEPRHEVAGLRPATSFVQCGAAKGNACMMAMPELNGAKNDSDHSYTSVGVTCDMLTPMTADDGRYLLSEYSRGVKSGDETLPPLWVLCNPAKPTQLLWLAGQCKRKDGDMTASVSDQSIPARQVLSCRYLGTILRPTMLLDDSPTAFYALPSLRSLLSHGCVPLDVDGGLDMSGRNGVFSAEFEIIGNLRSPVTERSMDTSLLDDELGGSLLAVRYSWTDSSTVLCYPTAAASCVVLVRAVSSDLKSPAARLLRELNQLESWIQVLALDSNSARMEWRQSGPSTDSETAAERTASFVHEVQSRTAEDLMQWRPDEGRQAELEAISNHLLPVRQDLDFTQIFWLLAKDAVSAKDASTCLLQVSRALLKQDVQPMVYRENYTALADLVRQCLQCTSQEELTQISNRVLATSGSTLLKALTVVIQTGFQKLERDFVHFFVSEELATWNQLAPFLITSLPPTDQTAETLECFRRQLECLRSLHCSLELVMMCRAYLSLPPESLRLLLRTALQHYEKHSYQEHPVFCLPLPNNTKDCLGICVRNLPVNWSCCVTAGGTSTIVQLSTTPPHLSVEEEEVTTPEGKPLTLFYVTQSIVTSS